MLRPALVALLTLAFATLPRFDGKGLFLEVAWHLRRRLAGAGLSQVSDLSLPALEPQEAAQEFAHQATNADLQARLADGAAGRDALLLQLPIVVGQAQRRRPVVNDTGLLSRAAQAIGHLSAEAA
jgi:hypothetical protein